MIKQKSKPKKIIGIKMQQRRAFTYKALNKLIQGSAADMTKQAMVKLIQRRNLAHIQIHDELDFSIESQKQADKIKDIMEQCS